MAILNTDAVLTPTQKSFGLAVVGIDKLVDLTQNVEDPRLSDALDAAVRNDWLVFPAMGLNNVGLYWVDQFKEFRITHDPKDGFALIVDLQSVSSYGPSGIRVVPNWTLAELPAQVHHTHFGLTKFGAVPVALLRYLTGAMPEWAITPGPITVNTNDLRVCFRRFATNRISHLTLENACSALDQIMNQPVSGRKPLNVTGDMFARKLEQVKKSRPNREELGIAIDQFNARIRHLIHRAYNK